MKKIKLNNKRSNLKSRFLGNRKRPSSFNPSLLKNFYILQIGQFVSQLGSKMTSFGLIMWSYESNGSVLSTSYLTVCSLLPSVLLSFLAGSFIDRLNKKKIILIADTLAAICSFITLILLINNHLQVWQLYLINIFLGFVSAFQDPASSVVISMIVPKEYYTKTSGLISLSNACTTTFTPILATSFYALLGLKIIILIDLLTFLFAFLSLLIFVEIPDRIIMRQDKKESFLVNCKQGIQYLINRKNIMQLILFMGFVNLIAAIYNSNLTPMILARNGNNKFELGIVSSAVGVAGIVGSILVSLLKEPRKRIPMIINIMTFSFLICNGMLGIGRNYNVWVIAVFLGNCLIPFLIANVEYIMRTKIPIEMQGRVFAARNTLQYTSIPVGYLLGGFLADRIFEPFMNKESTLQEFCSTIVGQGSGTGSALIYIIIGLIGFAGCCYFRCNKQLRSLDE
jgi:MFS transporter, DHA3 family, macrolide efflux protein